MAAIFVSAYVCASMCLCRVSITVTYSMHAVQFLGSVHVIMLKGIFRFSVFPRCYGSWHYSSAISLPILYLFLYCANRRLYFTKGVYKVNLFFRLLKALPSMYLVIAKASVTKMVWGPLVTFNILTFSYPAPHSRHKKRISKANCITTVWHWNTDISQKSPKYYKSFILVIQ